jgi:branched-chain amino acid transport system substrate-binding protein
MFAAQAYDAAMILCVAIEAALADGFEPNTDEFKTSVIAHMAATDLTGVTGHITFDQYNNPQKTAVVLHVQNGEETFWGYFIR